ncbi:hypothetical protein C8R43DRAFT_1238746 [Mycena crocata]|nr:hypothetical protein C8R43DRAFT_1238746 [Mycena crocata]
MSEAHKDAAAANSDDDRGRQYAFKVDSGKLPYSQNAPEECAYSACSAKRSTGGAPLFLCSGCRSVRFCCREHQVSFWPIHKDFCKAQMKNRERMQKQEEEVSESSVPPLQTRVRLAQDWIELHRFMLGGARIWALHESSVPMNFRTHYFRFILSYRPEANGDPSKSFNLEAAEVREHSAPGTREAADFAPYMVMIERANAEEIELDGFRGIFLCAYMIDYEHLWITSSYVNDKALPKIRPPGAPWYTHVQWCAVYGVVFRVVGEGKKSFWTTGLMEKEGRKWAWKVQSTTQLAQRGVHLSGAMEHLLGEPVVFNPPPAINSK